jgi:hypothetical protein
MAVGAARNACITIFVELSIVGCAALNGDNPLANKLLGHIQAASCPLLNGFLPDSIRHPIGIIDDCTTRVLLKIVVTSWPVIIGV